MKTKYSFIIKVLILILLINILFIKSELWNYNSRFDLTRAIVDQKTLQIDKYANNTGDRAYINEHYYSEKSPGFSFSLIPIYYIYKHTIKELPPEEAKNCPTKDNFCYESYKEYQDFYVIASIISSTLPTWGILLLLYYITKRKTKKKSIQLGIPLLFLISTQTLGLLTQTTGNILGMFFSLLFYTLLYETKIKHKELIAGIVGGCGLFYDILTIIPIILFSVYYVIKNKYIKSTTKLIIPIIIGILLLLSYNYQITDNIELTLYKHIDRNVFNYNNISTVNNYKYNYLTEEYDIYNTKISSNTFYKLLTKYKIRKLIPNKFTYNYTIQNNSIIKIYTDKIFLTYDKKEQKIFLINNNKPLHKTSIIKTKQQTLIKNNNNITLRKTNKNNSIFTTKNQITGKTSKTNCSFIYITNINLSKKEKNTCFLETQDPKNNYEKYIITYQIKQINNKTWTLTGNTKQIKNNIINNNIKKLLNIISSPYSGLLVFNTILITGLLFILYKRKIMHIIFLLIAISNIAAILKSPIWWGGTTFGPRLLSISVIFLFLPIIELVTKKKKNKILYKILIITAIISILINYLGLFYYIPSNTSVENGILNIGNSQINSIKYLFSNIINKNIYHGYFIKSNNTAITTSISIYLIVLLVWLSEIHKNKLFTSKNINNLSKWFSKKYTNKNMKKNQKKN